MDQTVRADLRLDVGSATQKVEVAASALTLDTDTPAVAQTINEKQVSELPLNGRSFVSLLFLEPGAVQTGGEQSTYRYSAGDAISIGGGISASNAYTLDGTMITDTGYSTPAFDISIDAIQEFKEQTKNYSAEYGFGANQVNLSTKSGTNAFHGSAFEFIRNTAVDARSYFNRVPQPVAPLKQNQFGYSLGGPVILPKIYNGSNKTFFFANYEGQRIRSAVTETGNVPSAAELGGVFQVSSFNPAHAATGTIIDPYTGLPFPQKLIGGLRHSAKPFLPPGAAGDRQRFFPGSERIWQQCIQLHCQSAEQRKRRPADLPHRPDPRPKRFRLLPRHHLGRERYRPFRANHLYQHRHSSGRQELPAHGNPCIHAQSSESAAPRVSRVAGISPGSDHDRKRTSPSWAFRMSSG